MKITDFISKGINGVRNSMGEIRNTREGSIVFPNGWVASIIDRKDKAGDQETRFSVAVCDYDGCFDWNILKPFGASEHGSFLTNNEDEVCRILTIIEAFR